MDKNEIVIALNQEIETLTRARDLILGQGLNGAGAISSDISLQASATSSLPSTTKKSVKKTGGMSDAGKARVAEAMKKRWAARRANAVKAEKAAKTASK